MAKTVTRQTLLQFGSSGSTSNFGQFGSQAAGSPVTTKTIATIQSLAAWAAGWQSAVAAGQAPYLQDMNSLFYVLAYQQFYTLQEGTPEWDSGTTYFIGSIVKRTGTCELYMSLIDTNLNQALPTAGTSNSNWQFVSGIISGIFRVGGVLAMNSQKITGLAAASTAGDALRYEQLFGGDVTINGNLICNPTTKGIKGTATNNDAEAGAVGEYITSQASNVTIGTTFTNITSISLTAGDWDVTGGIDWRDGPVIPLQHCMSAYSGSTITDFELDLNAGFVIAVGTFDDSHRPSVILPVWRLSLASTTTIYLKASEGTTGQRASGRIRARRMR